MKKRRVGIWGSYNHGNYGDDVMAVVFANQLIEKGIEPIVYRIDPNIADRYGFLTTNSLEELVSGVDYCIIGGGAWLCSGSFSDDVENDCLQFLEVLTKHECPLHSISIGGDGECDPMRLSTARRALFSSPLFKGGTVRLPQDVKLLANLGKEVSYHADVVLIVPELFGRGLGSSPNEKNRVGLNLNQIQRRTAYYFRFFSWFFPKVEIFFIQSHSEGHELGFEYVDSSRSVTASNVRYNTPERFIEFLGTLNALVSFKLHLGVTCMGLGVPFLSLGGSGKTKSFLYSLGHDKSLIKERLTLFGVLSILFEVHNMGFKQDIALSKIKDDAKYHLCYLDGI